MNKIDKVNSSVKVTINVPKEDVEALESSGEVISTYILKSLHQHAEDIRTGCPDMEKQKGLSNIIIACAKEYLKDISNKMDYIDNGKRFSDRQYQGVYDLARSKYDVMTTIKSVITIISQYDGKLC